MKTELKEKIKSGFFLNDIEVIRIKDSQNEQIKKISGGADATFKFEVRYKNGVISEPSTIDEIIQEENDGSKSIVYLKISALDPANNDTEITVEFADVSMPQVSDFSPIRYLVKSDDKDWTFISSSTISERLSKIKKEPIIKKIISYNSFMIINLAFMSIFMYSVILKIGSSTKELAEVKRIREKSVDIFDYVHKIDLMRAGGQFDQEKSLNSVMPYLLGGFILIFLGSILLNSAVKWYPMYTFYWGDQIKKYDSKLAVMKFVLFGVLIALILGVAGNYISSRIF